MPNRFFKTDDREDLEKDIALLRPQLNHLKDQADAERVAEQRELGSQIETLKQRRKAEVPALESKARELFEKKEKLHVALQETAKACCAAASEASLRSGWYDHQENLLWVRIRELAPAVIVERQKKWRDKIEEARLTVQAEERSTRPNMFGVVNHIYVSNVSIVHRWIEAISAAIKAAEEIKFQPLSETEIIQKLDAMEKAFPPLITDCETVTIPAPDVSRAQRSSW